MNGLLPRTIQLMLTAATLAVCGFFSFASMALATTTGTSAVEVGDAWGAGKWVGILVGLALLGLAIYIVARANPR